VTSLAFSPARFRVGTTVRYRLDKASRVTFTMERRASGKRRGRSCVKPTRALRKARRCTRYVAKRGSFTHSGKAGLNSFRFTGRLAATKLGAGSYRLIATPASVGGVRSTAIRASFRISR
jgi:hypothetical protein